MHGFLFVTFATNSLDRISRKERPNKIFKSLSAESLKPSMQVLTVAFVFVQCERAKTLGTVHRVEQGIRHGERQSLLA